MPVGHVIKCALLLPSTEGCDGHYTLETLLIIMSFVGRTIINGIQSGSSSQINLGFTEGYSTSI
jgi:hypothetical protein